MFIQRQRKTTTTRRTITRATMILTILISVALLQNCCSAFVARSSSSKLTSFQKLQIINQKKISLLTTTNTNENNEKSRTILNMVGRSAFGKAAIGLKRNNNHHNQNTTSLTANHYNIHNNNDEEEEEEVTQESAKTKALLYKRDRALLALQQHLKLSTENALHLLNTHPSLYTDVPSLSLKLTYLLKELNIPKTRLAKMLQTHPTLTTRVILDSEQHLSSTLQILQEELDLQYVDLKNIITKSSNLPTLLNYSRSTLKRKIRIYTSGYLSLKPSVITPMICRESRMLQINPVLATQVLEILRDVLEINRDDVVSMLQRDKLLLCYHPTRNTLPTINYLLHGTTTDDDDNDNDGDTDGKNSSVGYCLGLILRKGESTFFVQDDQQQEEEKKQMIIKKRLKELLIRYPNILSTSVETNLQPTIEFLKQEVGCTDYQLGRILYRRGNILVLSLDSLKKKVEYLKLVLDLDEKEEEDKEVDKKRKDIEVDSFYFCEEEEKEKPQDPIKLYESHRDEYGSKLSHILATSPDLLTLSLEGNLQPKFDYLAKTFFSSSSSSQELTVTQKQQLQTIFSSRPQLLVLSLEKNWKPKIQYLTENAGLTFQEIWDWWVEYPHMMSFTLEKMKERVDVVTGILLNKRRMRGSDGGDISKFWWQDVINDENTRKGEVDDDDNDEESILSLEPNFLGWKEKKWKEWVESNQ